HQHLASGSPDFVLRLPRILPFLRLAEVEQGDPCSFSGQMYRHRSAYAAVGAGDPRHPALHLPRPAALPGAAYRLRVHALLGSRTLLLMLSRGCLLVSHDLPRLSSRLPWDLP